MLNRFISTIATRDLARTNKYRVQIQSPFGRSEAVEMLAESVSFPGQNVRSTPDELVYGPVREIAHAFTYGPFSITFICTSDMREKRWFETWQDFIVSKNSWEAKFYDDYVQDMMLYSLNRQDTDVYKVTIYEAFPKTINAQEFSYASNDAYQTITVEFAYRWWKSEKLDLSLNPEESGSGVRNALAERPEAEKGTIPLTVVTPEPDGKGYMYEPFGGILKPSVVSDRDYKPTPAQPVANVPDAFGFDPYSP